MKKMVIKVLSGILMVNLLEVYSGSPVPIHAETVQKETVQTALELNDLSDYDASLQEELQWQEESLEESEEWKSAAYLLDEQNYSWVGEAEVLLEKYFSEKYDIDISEKTDALEVFASPAIPEVLAGFSDGTGKVYINERDLEKSADKLLHYTLHEMVHALGVDFYKDKSGMLSNAFYEGVAEALTKDILKTYDYDSENAVSAYDIFVSYAEKILKGDENYLTDLLSESEHGIASRIDEKAGSDTGKNFLEALTLLASGEEDEKITENCDTILQAYLQS